MILDIGITALDALAVVLPMCLWGRGGDLIY